MNAHSRKIVAVIEVFLVRFVGVTLLALAVERLFPDFASWQTGQLGFAFPVFIDVLMVGLAATAILLHRKTLSEYGLNVRNLRQQLDLAAAAFLPVVLASLPFGMGVDYRSWSGAALLAATQIALLYLLGLILHKKPSPPSVGLAAISIVAIAPLPTAAPQVGKVLAVFLTYALFVGFGEEIMYRGYIQSRLNEAFGKPYRFFGVAYGWGAVITALLFGLSHTGLVGSLLGLPGQISLAWGVWTFVGGLVFAFVREKSGGVLAPALLHGLPQAIASAVMLFL